MHVINSKHRINLTPPSLERIIYKYYTVLSGFRDNINNCTLSVNSFTQYRSRDKRLINET